jgi:RNA polymerase sigma-70 factor, ECF subfamily
VLLVILSVTLRVFDKVPSPNPSELPDRELVKRCLQGDTQIFRWLYQRHQARVRSLLYQLCNPTALDDLVQEVFLRAWKGLPNFRQTAHFSTWLYRITWNVASDYRKNAARSRSHLETLAHQTRSQDAGPDLMHMHYQDLVQQGLQTISFEHRTILVLHDLEDLPQKDISDLLGIPVGTVKSRLFHARASMRKFLQDQGVQL